MLLKYVHILIAALNMFIFSTLLNKVFIFGTAEPNLFFCTAVLRHCSTVPFYQKECFIEKIIKLPRNIYTKHFKLLLESDNLILANQIPAK